MEKRNLVGTKKDISLLGFGLMRLPLIEGTPKIDEEKALDMMDYAYAQGVNYFDTAYIYLDEQSEGFAAKALKRYDRESFFLADKMPTWLIKSKEHGMEIFQEQLDRCQVDYFDFYLCHNLGVSVETFIKVYEEYGLLDYLREEKRKGRIGKLGFSFHGPNENLKIITERHDDWDFIQIQLNYYDWRVQNAKWKYEYLEQKGIPCIVMEPVRGGALSALNDEASNMLRKARPDKSVASWAMRFAASLPNVATVLSGMTTMEQVKDNIETMNSFEKLNDSERQILEKALESYMKSSAIACTSCRYCIDCPENIDIPEIFAAYNQSVLKNEEKIEGLPFGKEGVVAFTNFYNELKGKKRPEDCIACKFCESHCPQEISIAQKLEEIKILHEKIEEMNRA